MKILILGKEGWLGGMFYDYLVKMGVEVTSNGDDINSLQFLEPDITTVVNFAAYASIDWCEQNKNKTFWSNVLGAQNVSKVCKSAGVKSVFISSCCILKSVNVNDIKYEDDFPSPSCFYTETKLMAERLISEIDPNTLIVRIRLPISEVPHPRNVLNKLSTYKKLIDTQESVVIVEDMLPRMLELIKNDERGIVHLTNEGTISPAEIGGLIGHKFEVFTKADLDEQVSLEGKARRTTTIVGSRRGYLPPIKDRIIEVVNKWKSN
jgi:dTDP-4-dehydrorhamnose reductase